MSFGPELVWVWSRSLLPICSGQKVRRVEGGDSFVVLSLGGNDLLLSWGAQNCGAAVITREERKTFAASASQTPPIVNALRSHLAGAICTSVEQAGRDKVLKFAFQKSVGAGFSQCRLLIVEIMERFSNILLTDENEVIIETAKHIHPADNSFRTVLPGLPYSPPPHFEGITLKEWLGSNEPLDLRVAGFGRTLLKSLSETPRDFAVSVLSRFYCDTEPRDFYLQRIGKYVTSLPVILSDSEPLQGTDSGRLIVVDPILERGIESHRRAVLRLIEKEITRRERQAEDIERLIADDSDSLFKRYGDLIVANLWRIKQGESEVSLEGYDDEGNIISMSVPLDPALSPSRNAERYFAKYKKISAARERAAALLGSVRDELCDFREARALASAVDDPEALAQIAEEFGIVRNQAKKRAAKSKPVLPPHKRFEFDNAIVLAGLSAKGNRYVTFKFAQPDDIWFHAQGVPGSHVILRRTAAMSDDEFEMLKSFCASLAVSFGKARGADRHRVDYTFRRYVAPIRGGEANVTYKEFSTVMGATGEWRRIWDDRKYREG
ncbi:MAG: NFACT family protein [Synergistes sp.]|nr:NFACT family protein [Synergistes sp.]